MDLRIIMVLIRIIMVFIGGMGTVAQGLAMVVV